MPGREGALHHSAPSAGARSCQASTAWVRMGDEGWYSTVLGADEAINDTCSPQDLCTCSVLPDGLVQSWVDGI